MSELTTEREPYWSKTNKRNKNELSFNTDDSDKVPTTTKGAKTSEKDNDNYGQHSGMFKLTEKIYVFVDIIQ